MDQEHNHCKPLDAGRVPAVAVPKLLQRLLAGEQVLINPAPDDLREMSKTHEITNLFGLAAHPIERPLPQNWDPATGLAGMDGEPALGDDFYRSLSYQINVQPIICIRGCLAGASGAPLPVEVYAPLHGAHLAMATQAMLWDCGAQKPDYGARMRIFCWHEPLKSRRGREILDRFIGYWSDAGFALTIGHDDPSMIADILWDIAQRAWEDEGKLGRIVEEEGRLEVVDETNGVARMVRDENPSDAQWLASLDAMFEEKSGAQHAMTPVWANPILPADCLAASPEWREAALAIGALPFGVNINIDGQFPPFGDERGQLAGWVIVPRSSLPAGLSRVARVWRMTQQ